MSSYENCPGKVQRCLKTKVILFSKIQKRFWPCDKLWCYKKKIQLLLCNRNSMFYIDNHNVLYWQYWKYLVIWQLKDKDLLSSSTGKAASVLYSCIVQWIKVCTYTCVVWFIQYLWTLICNYDRTTRRSFCCCLRCTL